MCEITLDIASRFATALVALGAAVVAFSQFRLVRAENRIKRFFDLGTAFRANAHFQTILNSIYGGVELPADVSLAHKIEFMGFFEDVAFLVKTGQMPRELAFYMFGGDVMAAMRQPELAAITDNAFWTLLKEFVSEMQSLESTQIQGGKLSPQLIKRFSR